MLAIAIASSLLLCSCAQTGLPLPPSLELPKPPSDLRATRKGNQVTLTWSQPRLTTDRQTVRYLGPTLICRSSAAEITECGNPVATLPPPSTVPQKPAKKNSQPPPPPPLLTSTDTLPSNLQSDNPDAEITYAVEVLNRNSRGAGPSNLVHVPAIATLPAPSDLAASLNDDGVLLSWTSSAAPPEKTGVEYRYRIYRRNEDGSKPNAAQTSATGENAQAAKQNNGTKQNKEQGTKQNQGMNQNKEKPKDAIAGEVPVGPAGPAHFLDAIEWEKTYTYWITAVTIITRGETEVQIEGNNSPALRVVAHDIFPPSVPVGLQAVYSGEGQKPFIDLIWAPVPATDLAGYNIYRREGDSAPVKLNAEPVKPPSYRDTAVASGKTYTYLVSAIDVRGNESAKSEETTESVP